jgi:hypothetical protein
MARFLAEQYLVPDDARRAADLAALRARVALLGGLELVESVYVPADEMCFYLFESDSPETVRRARRFPRVTQVVVEDGA